MNKNSTWSSRWKQEFQSSYSQKLKPNWSLLVKKLNTCFNVKYQIKFDHQHDVVYCTDHVNETCIEPYSVESGHRISERIKDHNGLK